MTRTLSFLFLAVAVRALAVPCPAGVPAGRFRLEVQRSADHPRLPARLVNRAPVGTIFHYTPGANVPEGAEVALLLGAPAGGIQLLPSFDARKPAQWQAPDRVTVAALLWGERGLDEDKVKALVRKDPNLVGQLADYARTTAQTETLLQALADPAASAERLDAAVAGFAASAGTSLKVDRDAPAGQQTLALMRALNPALSAYDPLNPEPKARLQQSASLAAAVAGVFLGPSVGMAAGGAAFLTNLRTLMFPRTEFRSTFAPGGAAESELDLCARREPPKSRTRIAYVWALRFPDHDPPALRLNDTAHVPIGPEAVAPLIVDPPLAARIRGWSVAPAGGGEPRAARFADGAVRFATSGLEPGSYRVRAEWDWETVEAAGEIVAHPFARLSEVTLDRDLIAGSGRVPFALTGADLRFVSALAWRNPAARWNPPQPLPFTPAAGPRPRLETEIDTSGLSPGTYALVLTQADREQGEIPVTVLPPSPRLEKLPIKVNLGETEQRVALSGSGLDRIRGASAEGMNLTLDGATLIVRLQREFAAGTRLPLALEVEGMRTPVIAPDALEIAGPRPRVRRVEIQRAAGSQVALRSNELAAGIPANIVIHSEHAGDSPQAAIECGGRVTPVSAAELRTGSSGVLFYSADPAVFGRNCTASLRLENANGVSGVVEIGRVVRLPRIARFEISAESAGGNLYVGSLTGDDLETIERIGWGAESVASVEALPLPGAEGNQVLRVRVPWPSPTPKSPLYIWLRGEAEPRRTTATY